MTLNYNFRSFFLFQYILIKISFYHSPPSLSPRAPLKSLPPPPSFYASFTLQLVGLLDVGLPL